MWQLAVRDSHEKFVVEEELEIIYEELTCDLKTLSLL
jgi:hypothetical protein